ncbi:MAG: hypothetical protein HYS62_00060 [Candidatus Aenigmarchaeota archaeon]|nr:hypothetical protein [Candidatus Aenigmarchaeota archaeon]
MRERASKFEIFIDGLIPIALVLLVVITVIELFFSKFARPYRWLIDIIDFWIILIFILDLMFKYKHAKSIPDFLKHYWPYIIAVFPFFLVIRVIERFYQISTASASSTIIFGRYIANALSEARMARIAELFRFINISARMLRATYFYENPKVRHKINTTKLLGLGTKRKR